MARKLDLLENSRLLPLGAYSERCRSAFRTDADRDSNLMPITIPKWWRSPFQSSADQFRPGL